MEIKDYISKSDFKVARDCPAKLYYKKKRYPSNLEANEYMQFLAEGGYVVGKLATLLRPGGIEIKTNHGYKYAVDETTELLKKENVTLYEAAIFSNSKLVRIDILEKQGGVINLIEVKSKSFDSSQKNPWSDMKEYLEDVAFQTMVLREAYPEAEIHSFLFLPDKAQCTKIDGLAGWFRKANPDPNEAPSRFPRIGVKFIYTESSPQHTQLQADNLLALENVDDKVAKMMPGIQCETEKFIGSVRDGLKKIAVQPNKKCFKCEYRDSGDVQQDGFRECWGALADVSPHISELYFAGAVGGSEPVIDQLIAQGRVSLYDIPLEALGKKGGGMGSRGERQLIQIRNTKENNEWASAEMKEELNTWEYPLQFIDFETSIPAIPFHKGMRPYELIAFQWSCHTIDRPGAEPAHSEWINLDEGFPNFRFSESLLEKIGDKGTPLMWATHENTVLRKILEQMELFGYENDKLKDWLERITTDDKKKRKGRLVDMCAFTRKHYFHPQMKGSNSLKKVLPAVWQNHTYLHSIPWFRKYLKLEQGLAADPYDTLGGEIEALENDEVVNEGTGAMRAYYEMMFGEHRGDPAVKKNWREKLLRYCELDTMSMIIVWTHWLKLSSLR
ncbi:MAG: DUF2779 domain-containing protein [Thermodesulfovibrionales bacterium]|nr:DUF2779 domain-containing protein [Thermodesulfovibrionales bacterium]